MKWTDKIEVFNEDCMATMSRYPDNYFDLAIVDPPYGININMNMGLKKGQKKRHTNKEWDSSIPDDRYFKELFRVSENQIIWGGNYFPIFPCNHFIFWDKQVPEGMSFSDGELAWTSYNKANKKIVMRNITNDKIHPTQKPPSLYQWIYKNYAENNFKIIDTHFGSGSHGIAVDSLNKIEKMNITLIASEIDQEYYQESLHRFKQYESQLQLF
jgi:site-specific DNA-methyltransferase (adenine-specific)